MPAEIRIQIDDSLNVGVSIPGGVPKGILYMALGLTRDAIQKKFDQEEDRLIQPATMGMPRIQ